MCSELIALSPPRHLINSGSCKRLETGARQTGGERGLDGTGLRGIWKHRRVHVCTSDFNKTPARCAEIPDLVNQRSRPGRRAFPPRAGLRPPPCPSPRQQPSPPAPGAPQPPAPVPFGQPDLSPTAAPGKRRVDDGQAGPGREPCSLGHGGVRPALLLRPGPSNFLRPGLCSPPGVYRHQAGWTLSSRRPG